MTALLDRVMDAVVLPGYTNVGYRVRRRGMALLTRGADEQAGA